MDNGTFTVHARLTYKSNLAIFEGMLIIPIVIGNTLLLCCICGNNSLRRKSFILIGNLAVSDLLIGCVGLPFSLILNISRDLSDNKYVCLLYYFVLITLIGTSVVNLFLISIDRYYAISSPLKHYTSRSADEWTKITFGWTISLVVGSLPLLGWNKWKPQLECKQLHTILPVVYVDIVLTIYSVIIVFSIALYVFVVKKTLEQLKCIRKASEFRTGDKSVINRKFESITGRNMQKTKVMILVLGVFAFCWAPFALLTFLNGHFIKRNETLDIIYQCCILLGLVNCSLNWIIFGILNSSIRNALRNLVCPRRRRECNTSFSSYTTNVSGAIGQKY